MNTEDKLLQKHTAPTSMRILVYDFLSQQNTALSLSEIEERLPRADRITIYRTLKTFEEKCIIHSVKDNNTTRYILCPDGCEEQTFKHQHLHFYCKFCKQTTCQDEFIIPVNNKFKFRIDEVRFFAKGICDKCLE